MKAETYVAADNKSKKQSKMIICHPPHPVPNFWQMLTGFAESVTSLRVDSNTPTNTENPKCLHVGVVFF